MLITGISNNDKSLLNALTLILVESYFENNHDLPCWKRRHYLLVDEVLRIFYKTSELWHKKVYNEIFKTENFKKKINLKEYSI